MRSATDMIPVPHDSTEAQLLLATARAECRIRITEKDLADQVVQRDILRLQYSRLQVARAHQNVLAAELHVGRIRLVVRKCGYVSSEFPSSSLTSNSGSSSLFRAFKNSCC